MDYSLCYSNAKSTLKVLLTFNNVEKTKLENFDFVHLLTSFFLSFQNSIPKIQVFIREGKCTTAGNIFIPRVIFKHYGFRG